MTYDPKEVGKRIAAARGRKQWRQLDLALQAGVAPSSVSRWERGQLPPARELMRIGHLLGVLPGELLEAPDENPRIAELERELVEIQRSLAGLPAIHATLPAILETLARIESLLRAPEADAQSS